MGYDRHGFTADAEARDCRGGAAMVKTFKAQATDEDLLLGAELQSIVFALCFSFDPADLHVLG